MTDWSDKTPPESISAMRVAIEANTTTCNKSLEWAVKTYALVAPLEGRVSKAERRMREQGPWALRASLVALAAAFVALACELVR